MGVRTFAADFAVEGFDEGVVVRQRQVNLIVSQFRILTCLRIVQLQTITCHIENFDLSS